MDGAHVLRRSPKYPNLRAAAGQLPTVVQPTTANPVPKTSHSAKPRPLVPVSAACNLSNATPEAPIPKLLTLNNKEPNRDTVPFPAFNDDFSSKLLEPAVQIQFNTIDWAGSSGRDVKRERAVSPRTSSAGLDAHRRAPADGRISVEGSGDVVIKPIIAGSNSRRNAVVVLQVSDQNGLTASTEETRDKTNGETAMLLTMHGFGYDLRAPRLTSGKQERSGRRLKMAVLRAWWRRMFGGKWRGDG